MWNEFFGEWKTNAAHFFFMDTKILLVQSPWDLEMGPFTHPMQEKTYHANVTFSQF